MVFFLLKLGESNSYLGFASGSLIDFNFNFNFNLMSFPKAFSLRIQIN
jgi:hypothetical protein